MATSNLTNVKVWLHGLVAAMISAFATGAAGVFALPTVFTFNKIGFINMVKLGTIPAIVSAFLYLKASPLPAISATVTTTETVELTKNT